MGKQVDKDCHTVENAVYYPVPIVINFFTLFYPYRVPFGKNKAEYRVYGKKPDHTPRFGGLELNNA